jgi:osmotically-inducible protein OsmY
MAQADQHEHEEPEHYRLGRIHEALAHDPRVGELELRVQIRAGKVLVAGTVATAERQRAVTEVVREVVPGLEVHNQTVVGSFPEPGEVERL